MQIQKHNFKKISFKGNRTKQYTTHQEKVMRDMKKAALQKGWLDIYTGEPFSRVNPPTIEHLISHSKKNAPEIILLRNTGFELNGLDNIFPAGSLGNSLRSNQSMKKIVTAKPVVLTRLLDEIQNHYAGYKSELIDGKIWAEKLLNTLLMQLNGICSDIKTRKIIIP